MSKKKKDKDNVLKDMLYLIKAAVTESKFDKAIYKFLRKENGQLNVDYIPYEE